MMEKYYILGEYPDGQFFSSFVIVHNLNDAIAIAQGIRKVTTVRSISVYSLVDDSVVFHDELKPKLVCTEE